MEGVSDFIVRALLSDIGGMDVCVTEFIRVTDRPLSRKVLYASCPELTRGGRTPAGTPVLVQLLGSDGPALQSSAALAVEVGALGIDLNFGCPARRVNGHDGGAALLRTPRRIERIVRMVRDAVLSNRPVSAKIRLGWENPDDVIDIVKAAEAGGASFITIHGRTKLQMYKPSADWGRVGRAVRAVSVPVVANGDVFTPKDLRRCLERTGVSAVMLGRGAFRTPNLFAWIRGMHRNRWSGSECARLLRTFVHRVVAHPRFKNPERAALARLKQWVRYMSDVDAEMAKCFLELKRRQKLVEAMRDLEAFFPAEIGPFETGESSDCTRNRSLEHALT